MSDRDDVVMLVALVNSSGALPVEAKQDYLAPDAPAASVQMLPGARWITRYVDGTGEREQPFAVLYRTDSRDSSGRADAYAALCGLADDLEAMVPYGDVFTIVGTDTPVLVDRADPGSEVWRATFVLQSAR